MRTRLRGTSAIVTALALAFSPAAYVRREFIPQRPAVEHPEGSRDRRLPGKARRSVRRQRQAA